jgi:signal transduction histidine kinase
MKMGPWSGTKVISIFRNLSLSEQFLLAAALVVLVTMASLGSWVAAEIRSNGIQIAADARARLIDAFLEPLIQDVPPEGLSDDTVSALDALFAQDRFSEEVLSANLWRTDGMLLYTTNRLIHGRSIKPEYVDIVLGGGIVAEYMDPVWPGHDYDAELQDALIETYIPLHRTASSDIVAIGEFHERALELEASFTAAQRETWLFVGITGLVTLGGLYFIVWRAGNTIASQQRKLEVNASAANQLAFQNDQLRLAAELSRKQVIEANEHYLTHIGSDIHDGPMQLLTLAMLNLSGLKSDLPKTVEAQPDRQASVLEQVMSNTQDALWQLRNLSAGLSLPEIEDLTLEEALRLAVLRHEGATGTRVKCEIGTLPEHVGQDTKICLYRVVQESLGNAFRHARGVGQELNASLTPAGICLAVTNAVSGKREESPRQHDSQGIIGMRNRLTAIGGSLVVEFLDDSVRVLAQVPFKQLAD